MKRWLVGCVVFVSALGHAQSGIDFISGNEFLERARLFERMSEDPKTRSDINMQKVAYFLGAVTALRRTNDSLAAIYKDATPGSRLFLTCIPSSATPRQLVMVLKAGLEKNPQDLHLPFAFLAQTTLSETYPCPG